MTCAVDAPTNHLRQLVSDLVLDVPGTELQAERYLQRAATDFFRRSGRWLVRVDIPAQKVTKIVVPDLEVVKVVQVQYQDSFLKERTLNSQLDTDTRYINDTPDVLELAFDPTMKLEAVVAVTLTDTHYQVESTLLNYYRQAILTGAAGMLMMITGKEFTDQNQAALKISQFDAAITRAWSEGNQFLGYCRKYYGERQHYDHCSGATSYSKEVAAYSDPRTDELIEENKLLRSQISALVASSNSLSGRINENARALLKAGDQGEIRTIVVEEIDKFDEGSYADLQATTMDEGIFTVKGEVGTNAYLNGDYRIDSEGARKI